MLVDRLFKNCCLIFEIMYNLNLPVVEKLVDNPVSVNVIVQMETMKPAIRYFYAVYMTGRKHQQVAQQLKTQYSIIGALWWERFF